MDRSGGDFGRLQAGQPIGAGAGLANLTHQGIEVIDVFLARPIGLKARIGGQVRAPGGMPEALKLGVGVGQNADVAVGGFKGATMGRGHPLIAGRPHRWLKHLAILMIGQGEGGHALEHTGVQGTADTGPHGLDQGR